MTIEERIKSSETRIFKAIFPNTTNHYNTLFGGTALQLMDEASFICATRFSRKRVVTVSTDKIDFEKPIPEGSIVELIANVVHVGTKSCKIQVDIFTERMYENERELAVTGCFTFVAINEYRNPISII
ncbi:acyl-CoA thioesterase [Pseudofulvibacter geojedonensis]|uniref:Acyl-CoA thioesterase n=1 Tax=Pseudofulvibacter geojedonensis TaxID=1123758 RepID=A0ABW3I2G1_9FLAO